MGWVARALVRLSVCAAALAVATHAGAQSREDSLLREERRVLIAKPVVRSVTIVGSSFFPEATIKSHMHTRKTSALDFLPIVPSRRLRRGSDLLDSAALYNWYRSNGFLGAHIDIDYRFHDESRKAADVTVRIHEGVQTMLAGYNVECPEDYAAEEVRRASGQLKLNAPFNPFVLKQVQYDLKAAYANAGHPYGEVSVDSAFSANRRQIRPRLECRAGPEVHFGAVEIPELKWTRPKAVQREIVFESGDLYRRREILESQQRLYSSGLFDYVSLEASSANPGQDTTPDFVVRGVERKPLFIGAKTGAKQDQNQDLVWGAAVSGGDRNFTGTGRSIRASAEAEFIVFTQWREQKYRFATAYTEPWPFNLRVPATIELAFEPGVRSAIQPYRIQKLAANLSLFREWSRHTRTWLIFSYERVDIYGIDPALEDQFRADQGISVTRSITFTRQRDTRNSLLLPTFGSLTTTDFEVAGSFLGGDNEFVRAEAAWSKYYQLTESRNVVAHRVKIGYLDGIAADDRVPTQERFFLGGANTVRGFKENSIGPENESGVPLGGELVAILNLELRRPLIGPLWMSMFADAGNNWAEAQDFNTTDWKVGAGMGLQFISPVGPIRVDYARRVIRDGEPAGGRVHVSILYAF
jgi:outer membrane protein insertion porin family